MSDGQWPKGYKVEAIQASLELSPESPSGLVWKTSPNAWVEVGEIAGTKRPGGWYVELNKKYYRAACLVLMLNNVFPEVGEVAFHKDDNRFNNSLQNLMWIQPGSEDYLERLRRNIRTSGCTYAKERRNLEVLLDSLVLDPTSPSGLAWKKKGRGRQPGKAAGFKAADGSYKVVVDSEMYSASRLVLILDGQLPESGQVAVHLNGIKGDNSIENLRWVTRSELGARNGKATNPKFPYVYRVGDQFVARYRVTTPEGYVLDEVLVGTYDTPRKAHAAAMRSRAKHPLVMGT